MSLCRHVPAHVTKTPKRHIKHTNVLDDDHVLCLVLKGMHNRARACRNGGLKPSVSGAKNGAYVCVRVLYR